MIVTLFFRWIIGIFMPDSVYSIFPLCHDWTPCHKLKEALPCLLLIGQTFSAFSKPANRI